MAYGEWYDFMVNLMVYMVYDDAWWMMDCFREIVLGWDMRGRIFSLADISSMSRTRVAVFKVAKKT